MARRVVLAAVVTQPVPEDHAVEIPAAKDAIGYLLAAVRPVWPNAKVLYCKNDTLYTLSAGRLRKLPAEFFVMPVDPAQHDVLPYPCPTSLKCIVEQRTIRVTPSSPEAKGAHDSVAKLFWTPFLD